MTRHPHHTSPSEVLRSFDVILEYNKSVDSGNCDDPRFDYNNPLHDVVCGCCGMINIGAHGERSRNADILKAGRA